MEGFNQKLEVGQLAMIISTRLPENSFLIGSIVTIEAFWHQGEDVTSFYQGVAESGKTVVVRGEATAVVSGCKYTGRTLTGDFCMEAGWTNFNPQRLMPLPPLEEKEIQKEKELEYS
jgi:hypothetical protein